MAQHADFFINHQGTIDSIKGFYGWPNQSEDEDGPFSFQSYLQFMLESKTWVDECLIQVLSIMFQKTITVIRAHDLTEVTIRHQKELTKVDLLYLYAGNSHIAYSAIGICHKTYSHPQGSKSHWEQSCQSLRPQHQLSIHFSVIQTAVCHLYCITSH